MTAFDEEDFWDSSPLVCPVAAILGLTRTLGDGLKAKLETSLDGLYDSLTPECGWLEPKAHKFLRRIRKEIRRKPNNVRDLYGAHFWMGNLERVILYL